jgi:hypothetical protein
MQPLRVAAAAAGMLKCTAQHAHTASCLEGVCQPHPGMALHLEMTRLTSPEMRQVLPCCPHAMSAPVMDSATSADTAAAAQQ